QRASNGAGRVVWLGESGQTASMLLGNAKNAEEKSAVEMAVEVLKTILAEGPVEAKAVRRQMRELAITEHTLRKAKTMLGIHPQFTGFGADGHWVWTLPPSKTA